MTQEEKIEIAENNKHISTEEIKQDIADTEADIANWKREIKGYDLIRDRMSYMRASARRSRIKEAEDFIEDLKAILEIRNKS